MRGEARDRTRLSVSPAAPPGGPWRSRPGLHWLRMPLPFRLTTSTSTSSRASAGWTVVDAGVDTPEARALWEGVLAGLLADKPVRAPDRDPLPSRSCRCRGLALPADRRRTRDGRDRIPDGAGASRWRRATTSRASGASTRPWSRPRAGPDGRAARPLQRGGAGAAAPLCPAAGRGPPAARALDAEVVCCPAIRRPRCCSTCRRMTSSSRPTTSWPRSRPTCRWPRTGPGTIRSGASSRPCRTCRRGCRTGPWCCRATGYPSSGCTAAASNSSVTTPPVAPTSPVLRPDAPLSVAEIVPRLFTMELDTHQFWFAFSEALAHVNLMARRGDCEVRRGRREAVAAGARPPRRDPVAGQDHRRRR